MMRETRNLDQLMAHYEVEKDLADRLRRAPKEERRRLYTSLYNEMFRRVPSHPDLAKKRSPEEQRDETRQQFRFLARFLKRDTRFLEIGPGDCEVSFEAARRVKEVYAVDVSDVITSSSQKPDNFRLILSDGASVPVPRGQIDVAYSHQLMEHLHPDDAVDQLKQILAALAPGGVYLVVTPSRLDGPHDISRPFDLVATGFHLKEYTVTEMRNLLREVGFSRVRFYLNAGFAVIRFPMCFIMALEAVLDRLPPKFRQRLAQGPILRRVLPIRLAAFKSR
jgi:SAM-dependent methyltransferase